MDDEARRDGTERSEAAVGNHFKCKVKFHFVLLLQLVSTNPPQSAQKTKPRNHRTRLQVEHVCLRFIMSSLVAGSPVAPDSAGYSLASKLSVLWSDICTIDTMTF